VWQAASLPSVEVVGVATLVNCGMASCGRAFVQVLMPFTPWSREHGASWLGKPLPDEDEVVLAAGSGAVGVDGRRMSRAQPLW
jgi:hypothetical protein